MGGWVGGCRYGTLQAKSNYAAVLHEQGNLAEAEASGLDMHRAPRPRPATTAHAHVCVCSSAFLVADQRTNGPTGAVRPCVVCQHSAPTNLFA